MFLEKECKIFHIFEIKKEEIGENMCDIIFALSEDLNFFDWRWADCKNGFKKDDIIRMMDVKTFLKPNHKDLYSTALKIALNKAKSPSRKKARLVEKSENGKKFFSMVFCDEQ